MPAQTVPTTPVPAASVDVVKLGSDVLTKFSKAIERGYNLPKALKEFSKDELSALKVEVDGELERRNREASPLANRPSSRSWTPNTA